MKYLDAKGAVKEISLIDAIIGKLNQLLMYIDCVFIDKDLSLTRKGQCNKCGRCCGGCRHLKEDNTCSIYEYRSFLCDIKYPRNPTRRKEGCGYYWD